MRKVDLVPVGIILFACAAAALFVWAMLSVDMSAASGPPDWTSAGKVLTINPIRSSLADGDRVRVETTRGTFLISVDASRDYRPRNRHQQAIFKYQWLDLGDHCFRVVSWKDR